VGDFSVIEKGPFSVIVDKRLRRFADHVATTAGVANGAQKNFRTLSCHTTR
jgi:hypothetical protein